MAIALFQNYPKESYSKAHSLFSKYSDCGADVSISRMNEITTFIAIFQNEGDLHCMEGKLADHEQEDFILQFEAWEKTKDNIRGVLLAEEQKPTIKLIERLAIEIITGGTAPSGIAEQYKAVDDDKKYHNWTNGGEHA